MTFELKNTSLNHWTFRRYTNERAQKSVLGVHYIMNDKPAQNPLVLPASSAGKPSMVMQALLDAGADISAEDDIDDLKLCLALAKQSAGKYYRKMGALGEGFFTPQRVFGNITDPAIVDQQIMDGARRQIDAIGSLEDWIDDVAEPAGGSSYCMLAIMMGLAAPLLKRVFPAGDEGILINLAGDTSRGKTTALLVGKSVSGPPNARLSWEASTRSLCEDCASASDTLIAIDDLDRITKRPRFAAEFAGMTHMLVTGESRKYSVTVKDQLPDLEWGCVALTGARSTIESISAKQRHEREDHERVRCLDIVVPDPREGGIWDAWEQVDPARQLSDQIKAAASQNYGTALHAWLDVLYGDPKLFEQAAELVEYYVEQLIKVRGDDGIGHRVAKKFGLIFAAGILAQENGIVPWMRIEIKDAVLIMHENALDALYSTEQEIREGLERVSLLGCPDREHRITLGANKLVFEDIKHAPTFRAFERKRDLLFIARGAFESYFKDRFLADKAIKRLRDEGALDNRSGKQLRVYCEKSSVRSKKFRYLVVDISAMLATVHYLRGRSKAEGD